MKVLVTGASGLLGRALAQLLIEDGHAVTVVQRRPSGLQCSEINADLTEPGVCAQVVSGQDAVLHLAAKVDVTGRWQDYYRINVEATRTLLDCARRSGVQRFLYVSSPSVAHAGHALFGSGAGPADARAARGHYARSKAIAERTALKSDAEGFAVAAIRPHLVWGPGDTQLVARIVERARAGRMATIGTGAALIDTTYVDNAATALAAGLHRCEHFHGEALVVSNGEPRPVADIVARLCAAAKIAPPRRRVAYPLAWLAGAAVDSVWAARGLRGSPGDPPMTRFLAEQLATAHWFDQRRSREVLAWTPQVSLEEGFARLARCY